MKNNPEILKFRYKLDKRARIITWSVLGAIVLIVTMLWLFTLGAYLPAWFSSLAVAFLALIALSIPRSIRVTDQAVEIRCLIEITHITYGHIKSVKRVEKSELQPLVPAFASPGFCGWFGYWLDVRNWDFIKVYATSWADLVMIEDIYEQRFVVNCSDPEALIAAIKSHLPKPAKKPAEKPDQNAREATPEPTLF